MKYLGVCISFMVGAAAGTAIGVKLVEKHYQEIADEEIRSVKETFGRREEEMTNITNERVEKRAYEIIAQRYGKESDEKGDNEMTSEKRPYVIPPEEFGETGLKKVTLNYYDDGVLTYENDDVINDVDEIVGKDSLSHFGEYEPDAVYVRNENKKTDYEVLADAHRYTDIYCIE